MAVINHVEERLPCGADLEALVLQVFDGDPPPDPGHQADCPHCQAALARLGAVHETAENVAAEPVVAPPGLVREVMHRLRGASDGILVGASSGGTVSITDRIVSQVASRAAMAVPEVTFASVTLIDEIRVAPLRLAVRLVAVFGSPLADVAEAVRQRVRAAVQELAGVPVAEIDVLIDDLA